MQSVMVTAVTSHVAQCRTPSYGVSFLINSLSLSLSSLLRSKESDRQCLIAPYGIQML